MLRLGTRVRYGQQEGIIVARTLEADPKYDIRFAEGRIRHYLPGSCLALVPAERPWEL